MKKRDLKEGNETRGQIEGLCGWKRLIDKWDREETPALAQGRQEKTDAPSRVIVCFASKVHEQQVGSRADALMSRREMWLRKQIEIYR
jgi:hypothetical protein